MNGSDVREDQSSLTKVYEKVPIPPLYTRMKATTMATFVIQVKVLN
jgi:hypothetical protein